MAGDNNKPVKRPQARLFLILLIAMSAMIHFPELQAAGRISACDNPREPVVAGSFFPDNAPRLKSMIAMFEKRAIVDPLLKHQKVMGIILPHAGYVYSGPTAGHGVALLKGKSYDKVILMAPDHRVGFKGAAITDGDCYITPLGTVAVHQLGRSLVNTFDFFIRSWESDRQEHAIEAILPYLQTALGNLSIVPVKTGVMNPEKLLTAIDTVLTEDDLVVASSDLSHYLDYNRAVKTDQETIRLILDLKPDALFNKNNAACGRIPLYVIMGLAKKRGWIPQLLDYTNSGDTAGSTDRVVGYCAIAFIKESTMTKQEKKTAVSTAEMGATLLSLARMTIAEELGIAVDKAKLETLETSLAAEAFHEKRGTFVTLHNKDKSLRGCIGTIEPLETIKAGIKDNAVNAAFRDPRFPALKRGEFNTIEIEVSLLTKPEKLSYSSGDDLVKLLRPGIDGVILKKGYKRATFLPQVWEQLRDPTAFLSHLCIKAGLTSNAWKKGDLEIFTYEVDCFEEPN